eukprot:Rhum_TRINITY_DN14247_c19_g1::Rhum_TRINITY_DN14247_c19_g1_i1::g.77301::m.77301
MHTHTCTRAHKKRPHAQTPGFFFSFLFRVLLGPEVARASQLRHQLTVTAAAVGRNVSFVHVGQTVVKRHRGAHKERAGPLRTQRLGFEELPRRWHGVMKTCQHGRRRAGNQIHLRRVQHPVPRRGPRRGLHPHADRAAVGVAPRVVHGDAAEDARHPACDRLRQLREEVATGDGLRDGRRLRLVVTGAGLVVAAAALALLREATGGSHAAVVYEVLHVAQGDLLLVRGDVVVEVPFLGDGPMQLGEDLREGIAGDDLLVGERRAGVDARCEEGALLRRDAAQQLAPRGEVVELICAHLRHRLVEGLHQRPVFRDECRVALHDVPLHQHRRPGQQRVRDALNLRVQQVQGKLHVRAEPHGQTLHPLLHLPRLVRRRELHQSLHAVLRCLLRQHDDGLDRAVEGEQLVDKAG